MSTRWLISRPAPSGCTRFAAQDRHAPKAAVPLALSTFGPRRPASAIHAHLTALAAQPTI
jgi:hypothetical protein